MTADWIPDDSGMTADWIPDDSGMTTRSVVRRVVT
jgi:hypothetical protein